MVQATQERPQRLRRHHRPRWVTATNTERAQKEVAAAARAAAPRASSVEERRHHVWEQHRRQLIRERAVARRVPWVAAGAVAALSMLSWGAAAAFAVLGAAPLAVATTIAGIAAVLSAGIAAVLRFGRTPGGERIDRLGRFWLDYLAYTVCAAGLVIWVGIAGPSWLAVGVWLLSTIACAARWWTAHPVGPQVPALTPPEPELPKPVEHTDEPAESAVPELDEYVLAWNEYAAGTSGKAKGSRLTNRRATGEYTITYDVELARGQQTHASLHPIAADLAGALGLSRDRIIIEKKGRGHGEHMATLTIIVTDPIAEGRYYTGPTVENGKITGLGRYADGVGDVEVTMWNRGGMVPTMIVGSTGTGKSASANMVTCGALSTGVMNLLYIDPKGNSSSALRQRARVAIIGKGAALQAPALVEALAQARGELGHDLLRATPGMPGWLLLHDEFSFVSGDSKTKMFWAEFVNTARALAMWPVAMNQALHESKWGGDHCRSAFAGQVIAFRINSESDALVPGLTYRPHDLPLDDNGDPIPGMAVQANRGRSNVPARWDWLPTDDDLEGWPDDEEVPPLTTSSAFDTFFDQPDLHELDYQVLVSILGEPVDGRWVIGGPNATHEFPDKQGSRTPRAGAVTAPATGFGLLANTNSDQLDTTDHDILTAIEAGHTTVRAIADHTDITKSTVSNRRQRLSERGWLDSAYQLTKSARSARAEN